MTKLQELSYRDVTRRLRKLGFRFYRQGKGSHELWVRDRDGCVIPVPHHKNKPIRKGQYALSFVNVVSVFRNLWNYKCMI